MSTWKQIQLDPELREQIISEINLYISNVIEKSNMDTRSLMNPVLARDPMATKFIERMVILIMRFKTNNCFISFHHFCFKIIKYYIKNFILYILMLLHSVMYRLSRLELTNFENEGKGEIYIVDPLIMIEKNVNENGFKEPFFNGLYEVLSKKRKNFFILSFLANDKPWQVDKYYNAYNVLASQKYDFITEYALLRTTDYLKLIAYIITYPFLLMEISKIKINQQYDEIFKDEFKRNLSSASFNDYVMYLVGKRLGKISSNKIKIMSWYENISRNKALYRGIRESTANSYIYGCQFFLPFTFWMHIHPLQAEKKLNTVPDEILVAGKSYCHAGNLRYSLGVSPRYNYLFETRKKIKKKYNTAPILVLLTIHFEDSINIINIVKESNVVRENRILIKLHPNHLVNDPGFSKYHSNWEFSNDPLSDLFSKCIIVISSGSSGSILEAATMGCTVISINRNDNLSFNVMPELGFGEIWDFAFNSNELTEKYKKLLQYRKNNEHRIQQISESYKENCFRKATEQRYCEIFQL